MESRDPGTTSGDPTRRMPSTGVPAPATASSYQAPETGDDASLTDKARESAGAALEKVGEAAHTAREQAASAAHTAQQTVDGQRDTVAGGLDTVATQLRDRAEAIPGGDATTQAAQAAAVRLEGASEYVREHDVNDMLTDLERIVRSHPTESLIVAAAAGFLVGRMFKS
ncbi:MAG TPA: hypothetical protein VMM78_18270 [Thermomicrobiales bacterium]|nr:hypothetical protein [Thermomicrobiales bacterium]